MSEERLTDRQRIYNYRQTLNQYPRPSVTADRVVATFDIKAKFSSWMLRIAV